MTKRGHLRRETATFSASASKSESGMARTRDCHGWNLRPQRLQKGNNTVYILVQFTCSCEAHGGEEIVLTCWRNDYPVAAYAGWWYLMDKGVENYDEEITGFSALWRSRAGGRRGIFPATASAWKDLEDRYDWSLYSGISSENLSCQCSLTTLLLQRYLWTGNKFSVKIETNAHHPGKIHKISVCKLSNFSWKGERFCS